MYLGTTLAALEAAITFLAIRLDDRRQTAARAVLVLHDRQADTTDHVGTPWYDCWHQWEAAGADLAAARRRLRHTCPDCLIRNEFQLDTRGCDRHRPLLDG